MRQLAALIRRLMSIGLVLAAVAACSALADVASGPGDPVPYPAGCPRFDLSPRRCAALVEALAQRSNIVPARASQILLLDDAGCEDETGRVGPCLRTTMFVVRVRFVMPDGQTLEESQFCGVGGQYSILCSEDPQIAIVAPTDGYYDVPCTGEAPETCATKHPAPPADAVAAARPIAVDRLVVPIDHVGAYAIELGEGSLANGILEESSIALQAEPPGVLTTDSGVRLRVESLEADGRPFDNYYLHGRREGVERVRAWIEFEIEAFKPGSALTFVGIAVR